MSEKCRSLEKLKEDALALCLQVKSHHSPQECDCFLKKMWDLAEELEMLNYDKLNDGIEGIDYE